MSAINTTAASALPQQSESSGLQDLSSDEFMSIILTELSNQDPLEPNDTNALLEQLSSIRAIESDEQLASELGRLVGQNELSAASNLIGNVVSGLNENNQRVAGFVSSVSRTEEGAILNLRTGERIAMERVDEVITEDELFAEADGDDGDDGEGGPTE